MTKVSFTWNEVIAALRAYSEAQDGPLPVGPSTVAPMRGNGSTRLVLTIRETPTP